MRFKILKGTETYNSLTGLLDKMIAANNEAKTLAMSLGAKEWLLATGPYAIAGGLSGLRFPERPKGWKKVFSKRYNDIYFPSTHLKDNQGLIEKIWGLTIVNANDLNVIVGYVEQDIYTDRGMIWSTYPGFSFKNDMFLLSLHEKAVYDNTNADIVEITMSEYKSLTGGTQ